MARFERRAVLALTLGTAACSLTGLGNYDVENCPVPLGNTPKASMVAIPAEVPVMNSKDKIGAYVSAGCVFGASDTGVVAGNTSPYCAFLGDAPTQPAVAALGPPNYAIAAVGESSCPKTGGLYFQISAMSTENPPAGVTYCSTSSTAIPGGATGVALPAVIGTFDNSQAIVTWFETPMRGDPIQNCSGAPTAPLYLQSTMNSTPGASLSDPATLLTMTSTSVRPAGMATLPGATLVAAPDGSAVSVWTVFAGAPGDKIAVSGLAGARAASIAGAPDGNRVAVVAEIGCVVDQAAAAAGAPPQGLAISFGTVGTSGGFTQTATVTTSATGQFAVQPTVSWVAAQADRYTQGFWLVSWISNAGGSAHALAQRYDADGNALGGVIDPGVPALASAAQSDGTLFVYTLAQGSSPTFMDVDLGCL
jgi:hypothetical protein